jgi:hypothetical protein
MFWTQSFNVDSALSHRKYHKISVWSIWGIYLLFVKVVTLVAKIMLFILKNLNKMKCAVYSCHSHLPAPSLTYSDLTYVRQMSPKGINWCMHLWVSIFTQLNWFLGWNVSPKYFLKTDVFCHAVRKVYLLSGAKCRNFWDSLLKDSPYKDIAPSQTAWMVI